jgi:hypothetical protein
MGADKNSSPKRELGLCPKPTTKDSQTSLPRSRSHNGPTNPRNKSQTNPTRKHNSKSKGLRQSGKHQADHPRCPGRLSARRARTVREESTNRPKLLPEPPVVHREKRTARDGPVDRLPRHGPSNTLVRTVCKLHAPKIHRQKGSKQWRSRTRTNTKNSQAVRHLTDGPR